MKVLLTEERRLFEFRAIGGQVSKPIEVDKLFFFNFLYLLLFNRFFQLQSVELLDTG